MSLAERATAVQGPKAGPGEGAGDQDLPVKRTTYGVLPNSCLEPKAQRAEPVAASPWKFVPTGNTVGCAHDLPVHSATDARVLWSYSL